MTNNNSAIITDKIRSYVLEETFADGGKIKNDSLIFREGYFDSMGFVRLVSYIENEFGIRITDEDLIEKNFESVNAISSFVLSRLN